MNLRGVRWCCVFLAVAAVAPGCASSSSEQKQFSTPDAAVTSLVDALRRDDRAKLKRVLGPEAGEILSSGDPVVDTYDVWRFLALYDESHRTQTGADGTTTLLVGKTEWPFPVPVIKSNGGYVFDTATGKEEVLNRRIGRNELSAVQVCLAIADAQRDYVKLHERPGEVPQYARKIVSDPGTTNGLYWPAADGKPPSPLGPLVASATAEGYGKPLVGPGFSWRPPPYHGYVYRLLTAQGANAAGGKVDYEVDGRLIGGFAVVAYPAQYGNSGIMTFITNHDGIVFQRDLGPDTERVAQAMTEFDPGPGWTQAGDIGRLDPAE